LPPHDGSWDRTALRDIDRCIGGITNITAG